MLPVPAELHTAGTEYPDSIRVSFTDGSTQIYDLRVRQPAPVFAPEPVPIRTDTAGRRRIRIIFSGRMKKHESTL